MDNQNTISTWWQRRSRLEILIACIIVLVVVGIIVTIVLIAMKGGAKKGIHKKHRGKADVGVSSVCNTTDCLRSARFVKESINISVDPCHDFYTFACGQWKEKHPVPQNDGQYSVFSEKMAEMDARMNKLIEKPKDPNEPKAIQDAKDIFKICMNTAVADMHGKDSFLHWVSEYGGWPMTMKNWNESAFDWEDVILKLSRDSSYYFISVAIQSDFKNSSSNAVYLSFVPPTIDSDFFVSSSKEPVRKAYRKMMMELTSVMTSGSNVSDKEVDDIIVFETSLAKIYNALTPASVSYDQITISQLANATQNQFGWLKYINGVFKDVTNVTNNFTIVVPDLSKFKTFFKVMKTVNNRTVANYLMWNYCYKYSSNINNVTREIVFNFESAISGNKERESRHQICKKFLNDYFPHVMDRLFVSTYVQNGTKEQAVDMVKHLRTSIGNILSRNTWMDDRTLRNAQEKANFTAQLVAYPEGTLNDTYINEYYVNLQPSLIHIENVRNVFTHLAIKNLGKVFQPVDRNSWAHSSCTVNAFHTLKKNAIVLPAGILQPPFFGASNIKAMNFGAIGSVIGHEMTHAFDMAGRIYDKHGDYLQWWTDASLKAYHNKSECIKMQYSKYCSSTLQAQLNKTDKVCLNGDNTLNENIADNGGIKIAINAYKSWIARNGNEPKLPGLTQFTPHQLFFISYAQVWCRTYIPLQLYTEIIRATHSPSQYRVLGTMSNSEDFVEAFKCKVNATMNPKLKCAFW